ncbi:CheR family methyltransferase [Scytonema millei]|uniref:protein-glutamate O-methyltransferase n=1 Tax=Scytonema millei VB511283 TaxID=1245923 RepID=A0A9X5E2M1_9CYAN|nr:CheR family methyltransferase [Scytonema millei]NHC33079.1 tetratricopeptide repeat protein [Scytonema millei VB511283]
MNETTVQNFIQLISARTGLQVRPQDRQELCKKLETRMKVLKLNAPEKYYQLLLGSTDDSNSNREWQELLILLTVGETYFFRDQGHFKLLKHQILPELIESKRKACLNSLTQKPSLRIWSAGCSSGQEPYSIAILVKELIPDLSDWEVVILGTDINSEAIEKARRGIYESWSFRQVDPQLQKHYFQQRKLGWELDPRIRRMVKFQCSNLLQDSFPSSTLNIHDMDIIICRNVFIYFSFDAIATVIEKFYQTLRPYGYLIVGHTELSGQNLSKFKLKAFTESIVYQRQNTSNETKNSFNNAIIQNSHNQVDIPKSIPKSIPHQLTNFQLNHLKHNSLKLKPISERSPVALPTIVSQSISDLAIVETLFQSGEYSRAIQAAQTLIQQHPKSFKAYYLIAQSWANLGDYERATHYCQQAIKLDNLSEKPYYLLARIAEEQGDLEKAKTLLKKIIYLAPESIAAYLELGSLYEKAGDRQRANKMLATALELLKKLSPTSAIEPYEQVLASELITKIKQTLAI